VCLHALLYERYRAAAIPLAHDYMAAALANLPKAEPFERANDLRP
jgi:hypothetical protein